MAAEQKSRADGEDLIIGVLTAVIVAAFVFAGSIDGDTQYISVWLLVNSGIALVLSISAALRGGRWVRAWCVGTIFSGLVEVIYTLVATRETVRSVSDAARFGSMVPIGIYAFVFLFQCVAAADALSTLMAY